MDTKNGAITHQNPKSQIIANRNFRPRTRLKQDKTMAMRRGSAHTKVYAASFLLGVTLSRGGAGIVASAIVPPHSSYFWRGLKDDYRRDGDDVPIVGDNFRGRKDVRKRKRRRSNQPPDNSDSDDDRIPFFYDREYDIDWREQYELDKLRRRRKRRQQKANDAKHGMQPSPWNSLRQWTFTKTGIHIPRINLHFDPITILKIRKSWHNIIPGAIVRVGADFETQHRLGGGIWRLRGCLEDKLLGGRFTMKSKGDRERGFVMEYAKSWLFSGTGK